MLDTLNTPESAGVPQQAVPGYAGPAPGGVSAPGAAAASAAAAAEAASTAAGAPNWLTPSGGATKYTGPVTKVGPSTLTAMMDGMAMTQENVSGFCTHFGVEGLRTTLRQLCAETGVESQVQLVKQQSVNDGPIVISTITLKIWYKVPQPPSTSTNDEEEDMGADPTACFSGGKRVRAWVGMASGAETGIPIPPAGGGAAVGASYQI